MESPLVSVICVHRTAQAEGTLYAKQMALFYSPISVISGILNFIQKFKIQRRSQNVNSQ